MSLVYPTLKPMLEASIRKLTVSVIWKEGSRERDVSVTEFVTNPQQGGLNPMLPMGGLPGMDQTNPAGTGLPGMGGPSPGLPGQGAPSPFTGGGLPI
jgi:general secretion pathway protein I